MTSVNTEPVGLAVVGVGWAGTRQLEALGELEAPLLEVRAIVDPDPEARERALSRWSVPAAYGSLDEALDDEHVEAVTICSPHSDHHSAVIAAARAGRHVLCEKPLATDLRQADDMIKTCEEAGVALVVAEQRCFDPMVTTLRRLLAEGAVGSPTFAIRTAGFRTKRFAYPGRRAWLTDPAQGGSGTWLLHGVHTVAEVRFLLGEIETVYATTHRTTDFEPADQEATVAAHLVTARGVPVLVVQTAESAMPDTAATWRIHGSEGVLEANEYRYTVTDHAGAIHQAGEVDRGAPSAYALELQAFGTYVRGGPAPFTTGPSEARTLAVVLAGYRSAESGLPVRLAVGTSAADPHDHVTT